MHDVLKKLSSELTQIAAAMNSAGGPQAMMLAHGNWSYPAIDRAELAKVASDLAILINERGLDDLGANEAILTDYVQRLSYVRANTVGNVWGSPNVGTPAYLMTLEALRRALEPALAPDAEALPSIKKHLARVRALEAQLDQVEPRTASLADMVERIEQAHETADQLPTDLRSLEEAREEIANLARKVADLLVEASQDKAKIHEMREQIANIQEKLAEKAAEADAVVSKCESAYSVATSKGLAAAFAERSRGLDYSMWAWVAGLVTALVLGAIFGSIQLSRLADLMANPSANAGTVSIQLLLSVFAVGAPVWFGWLATKQIGQRFRLAEDYAFKASISRAYEGYRREAARIDADLEARLLESALTRLDEQPLRLVEADSFGSPWHELASSDLVKEAMKTIPGFASQVADFARDKLNPLAASKKAKVKDETGEETFSGT